MVSWYTNGEVWTAARDVPEHALTLAREGKKEIYSFTSRIIILLNGHWPRFRRVTATVRSWNGTHDADIDDL